MILIYLDESGTNYKNKDGLYLDGPYLIFGAMCVYEDVYWSMERLFSDLIDRYFKIEDWLEHEVHATDIWAGDDLSHHLDLDGRREFFDEFLQLCGKLGLPYVFSYNLKYKDQNIHEKNMNSIRTAYCLLTGIEHVLADMHQTGVLICDSSSGSEKLRTRDVANINIKRINITPAQAILRQFYEMTSWRSARHSPVLFTIPPKYQAEAQSTYLIDHIHFLPSNDSRFLQMCDIFTFLVQRSLVHDYLLVAARNRIDQDKIPLSKDGLAMIRHKIHPATYGHESGDVEMGGTEPYFDGEALLLNLGMSHTQSKEIQEHYNTMQPASE